MRGKKKERAGGGKGKGEGGTPPRGRARPGSKRAGSGRTVQYRADGYRYVRPYSYEIKRKAVQLYLEEGLPAELVARELGITKGCVFDWAKQYREGGELGLKPKSPGLRARTKHKLPGPVAEKIGQLKRENPTHGIRKISQALRRLFCLQASPETVRRQVRAQGLENLPVPKARKKPTPPRRRFERTAPNELWQTDITYYPIQGKTAYIIGYIDDYSRYITGLGVYRSQTGDCVVETYRVATGEFGTPKELLSDNGRQYASWSGKTKFQKELEKDHVHHIRSAPHHPMTLGKIERFWQTLKDDFLSRARFETFEEAKERLAYWVKYYNHKRPHQGLDGMTPADRYFQIQKEMRAVIERGVATNIEEMARRGRPVTPFYMVGRMGDKSVVIETDRQTVSVRVDGRSVDVGGSMVYDMKEAKGHEAGNATKAEGDTGIQCQAEEPDGAGLMERTAESVVADEGVGGHLGCDPRLGAAGAVGDVDGLGSEVEGEPGGGPEPAAAGGETHGADVAAGAGNGRGSAAVKEEDDERAYSAREVPGSVVGMAGPEEGGGGVQGDGTGADDAMAVAGSGAFGYVGGPGTAGCARDFGGAGVARDVAPTARSEGAKPGVERRGEPTAVAAPVATATGPGERAGTCAFLNEEVMSVDGMGRSESTEADAGDSGAPRRASECDGGRAGAGDQSQDVLRVAGACPLGPVAGPAGPAGREAGPGGGPGEAAAGRGTGRPGEGKGGSGGPVAHPGGGQGSPEREGVRTGA